MKNYVRYLRRQPKHIQHVHAFVFAAVLTLIFAAIVLYSEYGFWRERYIKEDSQALVASSTEDVSIRETLSNFLSDAKTQLNSAATSGASLLEGKETYSKDK